jgi:hypothetical protein
MWKVWHDRNISNYFFYQVMEIKMKQPLKQFLNFMIFFILIAFFQVSAFAETVPDRDKKRDIRKLLEVSGILEQMDYIKEGATNSYSRMISLTYPKIPDEFWDEFNKLPGQEDMRVLMDRVVLVYSKHMSHDAIKQLIKMFSTPFWEEWKKKMPSISKEAGLIGSEWTQEILQSELFKQKIDKLVKKYDLEKINSSLKSSPSKEK